MEVNKINLQAQVDKINAFWTLKKLANINNYVSRIAKLKGDFQMNKYNNGEKLFYVIDRMMCVEFEDIPIVKVNTGEFVVLPKGADKPYAV